MVVPIESHAMKTTSHDVFAAPHDSLLQYAYTVNATHNAQQRIFANKKAISESLTRTVATLCSIPVASKQKPVSIRDF